MYVKSDATETGASGYPAGGDSGLKAEPGLHGSLELTPSNASLAPFVLLFERGETCGNRMIASGCKTLASRAQAKLVEQSRQRSVV